MDKPEDQKTKQPNVGRKKDTEPIPSWFGPGLLYLNQADVIELMKQWILNYTSLRVQDNVNHAAGQQQPQLFYRRMA